jgi:hypothetical protein
MGAHTPQPAAIGISNLKNKIRHYNAVMELKRASHCMYQIRYHMVFCIKYQRGLLGIEERSDYLRQIFHEIGQRY